MHSFSRFRKDSLPVLSRFSSGVYYFSRPQDYCMPMGRSDSCFCLLLRGEVEVRCAQTVLIARRGQLLYWPEGIPYHSFWKPENGLISYIAVYFRLHGHLNRREGAVQPGVFSPCDQFVLLSEGNWLRPFRSLADHYRRAGGLSAALDAFYTLYRQLTPLLPENQAFRPEIRRALAFMEENRERDFRMAELAAFCQLSESHLYHLFKQETSLSPVVYKNRARIRRATELLLSEEASVEWISQRLHFSSPAYFRRVFRKYMGMTPSAYRASGGQRL